MASASRISWTTNKFDLSPPKSEGEGYSILPLPVKVSGETLESLRDSIAAMSTKHSEYAKPFQCLNLGILAYTGDCTALAQIFPIHRGRQIFCPKANLAAFSGEASTLPSKNDWLKRAWFGRDISQYS